MEAKDEENKDLYDYDGYDKAPHHVLDAQQSRQLRQDSGISFTMLSDAIHHGVTGKLFTSQSVANTSSHTTVGAPLQLQPGTESSIFAIHDASTKRKKSIATTTFDALRRWLDAFTLPATNADYDELFSTGDNDALGVPRTRSLSTHTAETQHPINTSTEWLQGMANDDEIRAAVNEENSHTDIGLHDERLNLLLSVAIPLSSLERTLEWEERQQVLEEFNAIERVRTIRIEREVLRAQDRDEWVNRFAEA